MTLTQLLTFCNKLDHVEETFPFDKDTLVFKVNNKMFALTSLSEWENNNPAINLKCEPERATELRESYEAVTPGYHMNKTHWNTIAINKDLSDQQLKELILHSYELIAKPKKPIRKEKKS